MSIDPELRKTIMDSCVDDSTKIIHYLENENRKNRSYNFAILIFTILGAIGGITAAIVSVILLFK